MARQPIPMSPYDEMRTEYHLEELTTQGKLRKITPAKEPLPEWSTPVFVADQDAKGLLGRMVCAYGPANKNQEISTFPSADPEAAFNQAAGKTHHTTIDAIWEEIIFGLRDNSTERLRNAAGARRRLESPDGSGMSKRGHQASS